MVVTMPILVMKDEGSGTISSHVVPEKGSQWYAVKTLGAEIRQLGYEKTVFKTDQEKFKLADYEWSSCDAFGLAGSRIGAFEVWQQ